ncbi:putative endoglucanase, partial [Bombardia bombarda]
TAITLLILVSHAFAHMEISSPPPLRSKYNPNTNKDDIDYSMTSPLSNTGGGFPCKGYLSLLGTSQGKSVASWAAGSSQSFSVVGSATHGGGSCQTSLSLDSGKTFRVIHSYTGGCPLSPSYNFKVPADTPATQDAIFAWTWHNEIGDREMYMNCAVVNILPPGNTNNKREQVSFSSRPAMFEANIGNGCSTVEMFDVLYPNPGPDVTNGGSKTKSPIGSCGSLSSVGASGSYESS